MQNSLIIYADHNIDFSSNDYEKIANKIKNKLNSIKLENLDKLKTLKLSEWDEAETVKKDRKQKEILNSTSTEWHFWIDDYNSNYKKIVFEGVYTIFFYVTDKHIEFFEHGGRYIYWFGMEEYIRKVLRNFMYQIITTLGGTLALYISDQGDTKDLYDEINSYDKKYMEQIINELVEKYGEIKEGVDDYKPLENGNYIEPPPYFIDYFNDIKMKNNSMTWEDIENNLKASKSNSGNEDKEKLEEFKRKIIGHLDNLQKEIEVKNIIPFPKKDEE